MFEFALALNCTDPGDLVIVFENSKSTCFVYITMVLAQPYLRLSKEVCLSEGADWLQLICCQSGGGKKFITVMKLQIIDGNFCI